MEKAFKGIDISKHQASYNPAAAMAQGVRHVVVRTNYATTVDTLAAQFGKAALAAGQQVWGYGFATWHYTSVNGGDKEKARRKMKEQTAAWIVQATTIGLAGKFLFVDQELEKNETMGLGKQANTELVNECCEMIRKAGFVPAVYCSVSWAMERLNVAQVEAPFWLARYYWDPADGDFDQRNHDPAQLKAGAYTQLMVQLAQVNRLVGWQWGRIGNGSKYGVGSQDLDKNWFYLTPEQAAQGGEKVEIYSNPMYIHIGPASAGDVHTICKKLNELCIAHRTDDAGVVHTNIPASTGDQAALVELATRLVLPITLTESAQSGQEQQGYTVVYMAAVIKGGFATEADAVDYITSILGKEAMEQLDITIQLNK